MSSVASTSRAGIAIPGGDRQEVRSAPSSSAASTAHRGQSKIDIRTQRVHFLGRSTHSSKPGAASRHRPSRTSCRRRVAAEIEAAVVDYQNETLVALVITSSIAMSVYTCAGGSGRRVTATLASNFRRRQSRQISWSKNHCEAGVGRSAQCLPTCAAAAGIATSTPLSAKTQAGEATPTDADAELEPAPGDPRCRSISRRPSDGTMASLIQRPRSSSRASRGACRPRDGRSRCRHAQRLQYGTQGGEPNAAGSSPQQQRSPQIRADRRLR